MQERPIMAWCHFNLLCPFVCRFALLSVRQTLCYVRRLLVSSNALACALVAFLFCAAAAAAAASFTPRALNTHLTLSHPPHPFPTSLFSAGVASLGHSFPSTDKCRCCGCPQHHPTHTMGCVGESHSCNSLKRQQGLSRWISRPNRDRHRCDLA